MAVRSVFLQHSSQSQQAASRVRRACDVILSAIRRDAGTEVHYGGTAPPTFERGATGAQVPLHTSIISNFMIYQDQFEANLLQLFAHTKNSEWFSIISVISFEVNIVVKHVNAKRMTYGYGQGRP